jgi:hypothetical protein
MGGLLEFVLVVSGDDYIVDLGQQLAFIARVYFKSPRFQDSRIRSVDVKVQRAVRCATGTIVKNLGLVVWLHTARSNQGPSGREGKDAVPKNIADRARCADSLLRRWRRATRSRSTVMVVWTHNKDAFAVRRERRVEGQGREWRGRVAMAHPKAEVWGNEIGVHTLSTILHSCVASSSCWRFEMSGSITKCSRMSVQPQHVSKPVVAFANKLVGNQIIEAGSPVARSALASRPIRTRRSGHIRRLANDGAPAKRRMAHMSQRLEKGL